jgi:molybdopterin-dependent oxidoreductase alpha subunit
LLGQVFPSSRFDLCLFDGENNRTRGENATFYVMTSCVSGETDPQSIMADLNSNDTLVLRSLSYGAVAQHQQNYGRELLAALWENKTKLSHAWKILKHGVCDGCSLGAYGLHDNMLGGIHLCIPRLKLLKSNTMGPLDISVMSDISRLRKLDQRHLRSLGRLSHPIIRRNTDRGFSRISWGEAFQLIVKTIHNTAPHQMGFLAGSRGITNETYYVFQKLARVLGTNNIDLYSRSHAASVSGLKATLGIGAAACSLSDSIGADLVVIFGSGLANNRSLMKYLHHARRQRTRILALASPRRDRLERGLMPSVTRGGVFSADLIDEFFQLGADGEIAFANGVLKTLIEWNKLDQEFIRKHTDGFAELKAALQQQTWDMLERRSGVARAEIERFAQLFGSCKKVVFIYDSDLTQDEFRVENIEAIANLALARGTFGSEKCGIMPIHGDSGIQGASDCGLQPGQFPGEFSVNNENARRFSNLWRHPAPSNPGIGARQMIEAGHRHDLKLLYSIGTSLSDNTPDSHFVAEALRRIPMRIHQDVALNHSMLVNAEQAVLVLPGQTCYEQRGGATSTSTERRIRFTPEIPGPRIGESLPDWQIPAMIGRKSMPNGDFLFAFQNSRSVREEMSRVMPIYKGIEKLSKEGDQLQWGGPYLYRDGFTNMNGNRALFTVLDPPDFMQVDVAESQLPAVSSSNPVAAPATVAAPSQTTVGISPTLNLIELKVLGGYRLRLRFSDGAEGEVDLSHLAGRGVFARWKDRRFFRKVRIENGRALQWGDDIDLCVDSLYLRLTGKTAEGASDAGDFHA